MTTTTASSSAASDGSAPQSSSSQVSDPTIQIQPSAPTTEVSSSNVANSPASTVFAGYNPSTSSFTLTSDSSAVQASSSSLTDTTLTINEPPPAASSSLISTLTYLPSSFINSNTSPTTYQPLPTVTPLSSISAGDRRLSIPLSIRLPTIPEHVVTSAKSRWDHIGGKNLVIMSVILCCMVVAGALGAWLSKNIFGDS